MEAVTDFFSPLGWQYHCEQWWGSHEIRRHLLLGSKAVTKIESIEKRRHHYADKGSKSQSYDFSSSHLRMWELDHKEGWAPKNGYFEMWCLRRLLKFPGLQGDRTSQPLRKSTLNIHWKGWCSSSSSSTLGTLCKELANRKRTWCCERGKENREEGGRGWGG